MYPKINIIHICITSIVTMIKDFINCYKQMCVHYAVLMIAMHMGELEQGMYLVSLCISPDLTNTKKFSTPETLCTAFYLQRKMYVTKS